MSVIAILRQLTPVSRCPALRETAWVQYAEARRSKTMCRYWVLMILVLSLLDGTVSAQNNQQEKLDPSDESQGIQVGAGSTTDGRRYHSDYFDFTYSLPDGFVEKTEQYRSRVRAFPGLHPDPNTFILLVADERVEGGADPTRSIMVTVDRLSRYTMGPRAKDYTKGALEKEYIHDLVTKAWTDAGDDLLQEGQEVNVSGKKFFRADYKVNGHPMRGYRTEMITFQKGFALLWAFFAQSKAEVDSMASSMQRSIITK
jgi:hypothetical protein